MRTHLLCSGFEHGCDLSNEAGSTVWLQAAEMLGQIELNRGHAALALEINGNLIAVPW